MVPRFAWTVTPFTWALGVSSECRAARAPQRFFEADFTITLKVRERIKVVTVGIGLSQHEVLDRAYCPSWLVYRENCFTMSRKGGVGCKLGTVFEVKKEIPVKGKTF